MPPFVSKSNSTASQSSGLLQSDAKYFRRKAPRRSFGQRRWLVYSAAEVVDAGTGTRIYIFCFMVCYVGSLYRLLFTSFPLYLMMHLIICLCTAASTTTQALQNLASVQTLEVAASLIKGAADSLSSILPWPIQRPVAVLGADVASIVGLQPSLDSIERLAVRYFMPHLYIMHMCHIHATIICRMCISVLLLCISQPCEEAARSAHACMEAMQKADLRGRCMPLAGDMVFAAAAPQSSAGRTGLLSAGAFWQTVPAALQCGRAHAQGPPGGRQLWAGAPAVMENQTPGKSVKLIEGSQ